MQVPVLRPNFQETTCLGAALAAGIGAGLWDVPYVFAGKLGANAVFVPISAASLSDCLSSGAV